MKSIAEKSIWCSYGSVRMSFRKQDEEFLRFNRMKKSFSEGSEAPKPVAVFAWKLLDITEIWATKHPDFLKAIQNRVECFHENLARLKKSVESFEYETKPVKSAIETSTDTNTDTDFFISHLENQVYS